MADTTKKQALSFEDAMSKLEEKAIEIKKEDITLEEAMNAYEEGVKLYEVCNEILSKAEGKITVYKES